MGRDSPMKILFFDIETVPTEESLRSNGLLEAQLELDAAEVIKRLSLSAVTARILCLAYALEPPVDSPITVLSGDESDIIQDFWKLAADTNLFVGHNLLDFDLRFIYQRSVILRIKPSRDIPFARFRNAPVFDTMHEWSKWGREHISLDLLSRALGIASPKECLDGSKVYPYYRAGKLPEICEYCKCDVDTVRQVYRRLTFGGLPPANGAAGEMPA
jgi:predicted PolB exonuclease-like 3'-5' exonuclease